ncbi:hypothetical protein GUJ93_ZPchr0013g37371 [Zizania palustris]|uniref:Uncharacterized protein n=1 Tax=Zizania palustris TaxID=103762 RepID=A0A8J5X300_ZIZPA|nr:hypothetical protein GUJ93_ZPchr0013g37371 [Zizania palustris]
MASDWEWHSAPRHLWQLCPLLFSPPVAAGLSADTVNSAPARPLWLIPASRSRRRGRRLVASSTAGFIFSSSPSPSRRRPQRRWPSCPYLYRTYCSVLGSWLACLMTGCQSAAAAVQYNPPLLAIRACE